MKFDIVVVLSLLIIINEVKDYDISIPICLKTNIVILSSYSTG